MRIWIGFLVILASPIRGFTTSIPQKAHTVPQFRLYSSLSLLDDALYGNATAASSIVSTIGTLRSNEAQLDSYLNEMMPSSSLPVWTKLRSLARISKRARLASLQRTLDMTTPPEEEGARGDEDRRRKRALLALLRALSDESLTQKPAIRFIEKQARREQKQIYADMVSRRPEGLETPNYSVVCELGKDMEVRTYEPFTLCTVDMKETGKPNAFNSLAGYLFGKNQKSTAMKMTTPVFTQTEQMSFVLPSDYWKDVSIAPQPFAESGVRLETNEGGDRAVILFGGYASSQQVKTKKEALLKALEKNKEWKAAGSETPTVAQYNDPFTPPWKRLNEVSVAVVKRE